MGKGWTRGGGEIETVITRSGLFCRETKFIMTLALSLTLLVETLSTFSEQSVFD